MMALFWSRVADFTQRRIAVVLFSMTVVGTVILAQGGYGVVRRHRERKALEKSGETTSMVSPCLLNLPCMHTGSCGAFTTSST